LDGQGAEGVAQVVEDDAVVRLSVVALFAECTEAGALERDVEALADGVLMERLVEPEGEDEVLGPGVPDAWDGSAIWLAYRMGPPGLEPGSDGL
jgi:hypothetical protein